MVSRPINITNKKSARAGSSSTGENLFPAQRTMPGTGKKGPRKGTIILNNKRKSRIREFRNHAYGRDNNIGTAGSVLWKQHLLEFLSSMDEDITMKVIDRWVKAHPWITGPPKGVNMEYEQRRFNAAIPIQLESPGSSPLTGNVHPGQPTVPESSPSSTLYNGHHDNDVHAMQNEHGFHPPPHQIPVRPMPMYPPQMYMPPPFNPPPPTMPPFMTPQQDNEEDEKARAYQDAFNHIKGMGKLFRNYEEFRSLLVPLNNISMGVTRSHHRYISPAHAEVLNDYLEKRKQTVKVESRSSTEFMTAQNEEEIVDLVGDVNGDRTDLN